MDKKIIFIFYNDFVNHFPFGTTPYKTMDSEKESIMDTDKNTEEIMTEDENVLCHPLESEMKPNDERDTTQQYGDVIIPNPSIAEGAIIPVRQPTSVVLERRRNSDGDVTSDGSGVKEQYTTWSKEIADMYAKEQGLVSANELHKYEREMTEILRNISNFQLSITEEVNSDDETIDLDALESEDVAMKEHEKSTRVIDPTNEDDLVKLVSQHEYSGAFKPISSSVKDPENNPIEDISISSLTMGEVFVPGEYIYIPGICRNVQYTSSNQETKDTETITDTEVKDSEEEEEEEEYFDANELLKLRRRKYFPIPMAEMVKTEKEMKLNYELLNRVPSPILGMPMKTPFIYWLIISNKNFPVVDHSNNAISLYARTIALLEKGNDYEIESTVLVNKIFEEYVEVHRLQERFNEFKFLHFSHFMPKNNAKTFLELFPDPFSQNAFENKDGLRTDHDVHLAKNAFDIWYGNYVEDWMLNIFSNADVAKTIIYHWFRRIWVAEFIPLYGMDKLAAMKVNYTSANILATHMGGFYFDKETLRQWIICWCRYEMEFAMLLNECTMKDQINKLKQEITRRLSSLDDDQSPSFFVPATFAPWEHLSIEDERELWKYMYNDIYYKATLNVMRSMELYILRRAQEGPDVYMNMWPHLMSPDLNLISENDGNCPDVPYAPKDFVCDDSIGKCKFLWYRDILLRKYYQKCTLSVDGTIQCDENFPLIYVKHVISDRIAPDGSSKTYEYDTFDYDAFDDEKPNNNELVFPEIEWSPSFCVMREHWTHLHWLYSTDNDWQEVVVPSFLDNPKGRVYYDKIPNFISITAHLKDCPEIQDKLLRMKYHLGLDRKRIARKKQTVKKDKATGKKRSKKR